MRFPKIDEVAAELRNINKMQLEADDADEGIDVRLQVYPDGDWAVRWGSSDYDQDHRGYWGASSVPGNNRRFDSKDVARELIGQAKEAFATGGEGMEESRRQPSLPGFPDIPPDLDVKIPTFNWRQIGGDMDPGAYGGIIAKADGEHIELLEIQPVREYVGDKEAADVGFPFWTKEAWFDLADLDPKNKDVQDALHSAGFDSGDQKEWFEEEATPEDRAVVIAEALLWGRGEDGPSGWSEDLPDIKVRWNSGQVVSIREFLADEDDEFRRDVLEEENEEEEEPEEEERTYTYTIFDDNPGTSSGTAWPDHQDIEIEADSDEEAIDAVRDVMSQEATGLNPDDGYDVGQRLYAIVWDGDSVIVGEPTYTLTAEDLGVEDED